MIEIIFFDLGGVIFSDFFSGGEKELSKALGTPSEVTIDAYTKTDFPAYSKNEISDEQRWRYFVEEVGLPEAKIATCMHTFYKSYHMFSEVVAYIKTLKEKNKYRLGILSDQPIGIAKYLRKEYPNIFSLFETDLIIISAEVGFSKKDADNSIYTLAIEKSHVSPDEILFVDNSLSNIDNAKSLGLNTYYFDIKNQHIPVLLEGLEKKLG